MLNRRITSSKSQRKERPDQTIKSTVMYHIVCGVCLYVVIMNLWEGPGCVLQQLVVVAPYNRLVAAEQFMCLLRVWMYRWRSDAVICTFITGTAMLQTGCFTAQHKHVCTTQYSGQLKEASVPSWEACVSLSQDVFSQMGAHRASVFLLTGPGRIVKLWIVWMGRRSNPAEYKESSRRCLDRRSNPHWLAFSCVGRAVYLKTDSVNI